MDIVENERVWTAPAVLRDSTLAFVSLALSFDRDLFSRLYGILVITFCDTGA